MKTIPGEQIEKNLNSLRAPIININGEGISWNEDPGAVIAAWKGECTELSASFQIDSLIDIICLNVRYVKKYVQGHLIHPEEMKKPGLSSQFELLVALVAFNQISQTIPSITIPDEFWNDYTGESSHFTDPTLSYYIRRQDIRRLTFFLIRTLLKSPVDSFFEVLGIDPVLDSGSLFTQEHARLNHEHEYTSVWLYRIPEGLGIFLVLYTGQCRFARCFSCSLHLLGSKKRVNSFSINRQVDSGLLDNLLSKEAQQVREIILSNNGSVFDRKTIPLGSVLYAIAIAIHRFPDLKKIVFETRVEYIHKEYISELRRIVEYENKDIRMEVGLGFEIFDDHFRNHVFKKNLSLEQVEKACETLSEESFSLRIYMLFHPLPQMDLEQSVLDMKNAITFFSRLSDRTGVPITIHINPTYVARSSMLEQAFHSGDYIPPSLKDIRNVLKSYSKTNLKFHIGLSDEGLAVKGGSFLDVSSEEDFKILTAFNQKQNFDLL